MDTKTIFQNYSVVTDEADALLSLGREKHWFFELMDEKGVIPGPVLKSEWLYVPIESDSTTLPGEAQKILEAIQEKFPIKQVIIGHEVKEDQEQVVKEIEPPKAEPKNIPWEGIAKVSLVVLTGAALALLYGIAMALSVIDPCLIVVLETGEWICLARWVD